MKTLVLTPHGQNWGREGYTTPCFFCGNEMYIEDYCASQELDEQYNHNETTDSHHYKTKLMLHLLNCHCDTCTAHIGVVSYYGKLEMHLPKQLTDFDPPV